MSVIVSSDVWKYSKARGRAKLLLIAIADNADTETRKAWPSIQYLVQKTGISESTVHRLIKALMDLGELSVTPREGRSSIFTILVRGVTMTPPTSVGSVTTPPRGVSPWDPGGVTMTPRTVIEPSLEPSTKQSTCVRGFEEFRTVGQMLFKKGPVTN